MTPDPGRSQALEGFGYTVRQAQFLLLVALHGGYFLRRQYVAFTGRAHGQAAVRFLANTVTRAHVRVLPYGRRGHVFHLCARPLYAAIGDEHNRNRRVAEWDAVMRKLMSLDFALAHPSAQFWVTEVEKATLLRDRFVPPSAWPARHYAAKHTGGLSMTRYFVDKMPWYRDAGDARLWVAYVDAERTLHGFETFLDQYRAVLLAVPSGVTYVAPAVWRGAVEPVFNKIIRRPTPKGVSAEAFRHYCRTRRDVAATPLAAQTADSHRHVEYLHAPFRLPQFEALYQAWVSQGDEVVTGTAVGRIVQPNCDFRVHVLKHRYDGSPASSHPTTGRDGDDITR